MSLEQLKEIQAVVTDVDGVMTDGGIVVGSTGETKTFSVRDGMGIKLLRKCGLAFGLLSGRASPALTRRARELGIEIIKTGRLDKQLAFSEIAREMGLPHHRIAYIGDDIPDLAPLRMAGVGFCPQDAVAEVRTAADQVVPLPGGRGVVRHVIEMVLEAKGLWAPLVAGFEVKDD